MTGVAEAGNDERSDPGQMDAEKQGSDSDPKSETVEEQQATVEMICKEGKTATGIFEFECISSSILNGVSHQYATWLACSYTLNYKLYFLSLDQYRFFFFDSRCRQLREQVAEIYFTSHYLR